MPIPRYFIAENAKVLKEREKLMNTVLGQMQPIDEEVRHYSIHIAKAHSTTIDC